MTMTYASLIQKLFQVNLFNGKKNGLENCHRLDRLLSSPHQQFPSIHIAGTNGKGSTGAKIAHALEAAGHRVGLFTSPHISCFRERISINGEQIPEEDVVELLTRLFSLVEEESIPATFFEITTFLALLYFARKKIDFAVIETGLGGRWDATNVITPLLSIITSISLDHTEILGNSIDSIALEKAGIIKPNRPVLIGPRVPFHIVKQVADALQSPCIQADRTNGTFEDENSSIAKAALKQISTLIHMPESAIALGLTVKPPCRFEQASQNPRIIIDVAHNPDGLEQLFHAAQIHYPKDKLRVLFGFSKTKDIRACLAILVKYGHFFYPVEAANGKCAAAQDLEKALRDIGVAADKIFSYTNLVESVKQGQQDAEKEGHVLLICGTFFIMDEVKKSLAE